MENSRSRVLGLVQYMRWAIPIAVSFLGVGYILVEEGLFRGTSLADSSVLRTIIVIGLAGPALVWITLTWAANAALAEAEAKSKLALRNSQARRRALHLRTASFVGQHASALLDTNLLLSEVVTLVCAKFGYTHAFLLLVHEPTRELVLKEGSGPLAESIKAQGLRIKIGKEGITGWVAETGEPLLCGDVHSEPRYYAGHLVPETKSELAVPLRVGTHIVGVLDVQSDLPNAFDKEDVTVLQILGNQIGIALENARLFQETNRRYEAMVALHEISLDMISQLDTTELLDALLRRGAHLLSAHASALFLYDASRDIISNVANNNTWRDWTGVTLRVGEGIVGHMVKTGDSLLMNDYSGWDGKTEIFLGGPHTRLIGTPLRWRDQIIGGIIVGNRAEDRVFDDNDLWLLRLFADLASIAIKNAELHTQVKSFNQFLESNIAERTEELFEAKEEIAEKAQQLRSLLAKTIRIQDEERARISRDMHDGVVQLITSARYEIQAAKVVAGRRLPSAAQQKLAAARQVLEEAEVELRRAIYDLYSPILDAVGLVPALQKQADRFQDILGISCDIVVRGESYRLGSQAEVAIYRIVEEALNNVLKHAEAKSISVLLEFDPTELHVDVWDDGRGFDYQRPAGTRNGYRLGLLGMEERVANLGGKMAVSSEKGEGTRISISLPTLAEASENV